jgi:hypothetical protein
MLRERIVWIVALLLVAGAGFYSGQIIGGRAVAAERAQATAGFFSQRGGGQAGGQANGQAGGNFRGGGAAGTVSEVSGNTITITTRNGQTMKIELAANGTVRKQVDGQISDITTGEQIVAMGTQNGDTFQATSIQIGGFGGGPGGGGNGGGRNAQSTPTP